LERTFHRNLGVNDRAVESFIKDRQALLAFYEFPPNTGNICGHQRHRKRIRDRASSHGVRKGMSIDQDPLAMIFKFAEAAKKAGVASMVTIH
jgi:hypothetical protein